MKMILMKALRVTEFVAVALASTGGMSSACSERWTSVYEPGHTVAVEGGVVGESGLEVLQAMDLFHSDDAEPCAFQECRILAEDCSQPHLNFKIEPFSPFQVLYSSPEADARACVVCSTKSQEFVYTPLIIKSASAQPKEARTLQLDGSDNFCTIYNNPNSNSVYIFDYMADSVSEVFSPNNVFVQTDSCNVECSLFSSDCISKSNADDYVFLNATMNVRANLGFEQGYQSELCLKCDDINSQANGQFVFNVTVKPMCANVNRNQNIDNPFVVQYENTDELLQMGDINTYFQDQNDGCPKFTSCQAIVGECASQELSSFFQINDIDPFVISVRRNVQEGYDQTICLKCLRPSLQSNKRITVDYGDLRIVQTVDCSHAITINSDQAVEVNLDYADTQETGLVATLDSLFTVNSDYVGCSIPEFMLSESSQCSEAYSGDFLTMEGRAVRGLQNVDDGWQLAVFVCASASGATVPKGLNVRQYPNCADLIQFNTSNPLGDQVLEIATTSEPETILTDVRQQITIPDTCHPISTCTLLQSDCQTEYIGRDLMISQELQLQATSEAGVGWISEVCLRCSTEVGDAATSPSFTVRRKAACNQFLIAKQDPPELSTYFQADREFIQVDSLYSHLFISLNEDCSLPDCQVRHPEFVEGVETSDNIIVGPQPEYLTSIRANAIDGYAQTLSFTCFMEGNTRISASFSISQRRDCTQDLTALEVKMRELNYSQSIEPATAYQFDEIFTKHNAPNICFITGCIFLDETCSRPYTGDVFSTTDQGQVMALSNNPIGYNITTCMNCSYGNDHVYFVSNSFTVWQKMNCEMMNQTIPLGPIQFMQLYSNESEPQVLEGLDQLLEVQLYRDCGLGVCTIKDSECIKAKKKSNFVIDEESMQIKAQLNVLEGYNESICFECVNGHQTTSQLMIAMVQHKYCGTIVANEQAATDLQFEYNDAQNFTAGNVSQFFTRSENGCDIIGCLVMDEQCAAANQSRAFYTSQSQELLARTDIMQGYNETICLKCRMIQGESQVTIKLEQLKHCSLAHFAAPETEFQKEHDYEDTEEHTKLEDAHSKFETESHCPVNACSLKISPNCEEDYTGVISIDVESPFHLKARRNIEEGYSETVCVVCSNGYRREKFLYTIRQGENEVVVEVEEIQPLNHKPFLTNPPQSQEYVLKLGDLIEKLPKEEEDLLAEEGESVEQVTEPEYEEVEQQLVFRFEISEAQDEALEMKSLKITTAQLGKVTVDYSRSGSISVVEETKLLSYDPQSTMLTITFSDEEQLRGAEGPNQITITLEDQGGETMEYSAFLTITIPEREKPTDESGEPATPDSDETEKEDGTDDDNKDETKPNEPASGFSNFKFTKKQQMMRNKLQKAMNQQRSNQNQAPVEVKVPKELKVSVSEISREGVIKVKPNQKIEVPPLSQIQSRRDLEGLDIGVNDIFDIKINFNSDDSKKMTFSQSLQEWTEDEIKVKIDFDNPLVISQGFEKDQVTLQIKPESSILFVAKDSGLSLQPKDLKVGGQVFIPKQLPDFMPEKTVKSSALAGTSGLSFIAFINLGLSFVLKSSIDQIWSLFLTLQIIKELPLYMEYIPAHLDMVLLELKKFIDFEMLSPDSLLKNINEEWSVAYLIDSTVGAYKQSDSLLPTNVQTLLLVAVMFAISITCLVCFAVVAQKYRNKVKQKLVAIKDKMLFNGIIRSVTLSYLAQGVMLIQEAKKLWGGDSSTKGSYPLFAALTTYMLFYPLWVIFFLIRQDKDTLLLQETRDRYGNFYSGISLNRHKYTVLYYPISILRRFIFVAILIGLFGNSLKLELLVFSSQLYQITYMSLWPHESKVSTFIQIFNETVFVFVTFNMMLMADSAIDINVRFQFGSSMISLLGLLALTNIFFTTKLTISRFLRLREYKKIRNEKIAAHKKELSVIAMKQKETSGVAKSIQALRSQIDCTLEDSKNDQEKIAQRHLIESLTYLDLISQDSPDIDLAIEQQPSIRRQQSTVNDIGLDMDIEIKLQPKKQKPNAVKKKKKQPRKKKLETVEEQEETESQQASKTELVKKVIKIRF